MKDDFLFRLACSRNHLDFVKWIYSLGDVNIKANRNQAFKLVCENNYTALAMWLQEKNPEEYHIVIENDQITQWNIIKVIIVNNSKYVDSIDTCPICYVNECQIITDCNHQYCMSCIKSYMEKKCDSLNDVTCPMCRKDNMIFFKVKQKIDK